MNLREGIKLALAANAPLTALIAGRFWFGYAPTGSDKVGPWVVATVLSGKEELAMDGDNGLTHPLIQFTVGGTNKVNVDATVQALIDLNGTEYDYVLAGVTHRLTFFHKDNRDGWNDGERVQDPSVDLEVWANK